MSQNDFVIANANGATVRADINSALQALASSSKGSTRPSTVYAGQLWLEDDNPSSTVWTLRLYDGTNDIALGQFDITNDVFLPAPQSSRSVSTSAGTMDIGAVYAELLTSSSTTTVTSLGTAAAGTIRTVWHSAAQQYTHNGTSLICQNAANFTTAAGDFVTWLSLGSGNWRMMNVYRAGSGATIAGVTAGAGLTGGGTSGTVNLDVGAGTGITVNANDVAVTIPIRAWGYVSSGGALNAGSGVSAVSRTATGQYTITLSPAMANTNYAIIAMCVGVQGIAVENNSVVTKSTTQFGIRTRASGAGDLDFAFYFIVVQS